MALMIAEQIEFTVQAGRADVANCSGAPVDRMASEKVFDAIAWLSSATVTRMLNRPATVGVPLKTPAVDKVSPDGSPTPVHV